MKAIIKLNFFGARIIQLFLQQRIETAKLSKG